MGWQIQVVFRVTPEPQARGEEVRRSKGTREPRSDFSRAIYLARLLVCLFRVFCRREGDGFSNVGSASVLLAHSQLDQHKRRCPRRAVGREPRCSRGARHLSVPLHGPPHASVQASVQAKTRSSRSRASNSKQRVGRKAVI